MSIRTEGLFQGIDLAGLPALEELAIASDAWVGSSDAAKKWQKGAGSSTLEQVGSLLCDAQDVQRAIQSGRPTKGPIPSTMVGSLELPVIVGEMIYLPGDKDYHQRQKEPDARVLFSVVPAIRKGEAKICESAARAADSSYPSASDLPAVLAILLAFAGLFLIQWMPWMTWVEVALVALTFYSYYQDQRRQRIVAAFRTYLSAVPLPNGEAVGLWNMDEELQTGSSAVGYRKVMGAVAVAAVFLFAISIWACILCLAVLLLGSVWLLYREHCQVLAYEAFRPYIEAEEKRKGRRWEQWLACLEPAERDRWNTFGVLATVAHRLELSKGPAALTVKGIVAKLLD